MKQNRGCLVLKKTIEFLAKVKFNLKSEHNYILLERHNVGNFNTLKLKSTLEVLVYIFSNKHIYQTKKPS